MKQFNSKNLESKERVKIPIIDVFLKCPRILFLGIFAGMATFVLFYLVTAYLLSYSTNHLELPYHQALQVEMIGAIFCGILPL